MLRPVSDLNKKELFKLAQEHKIVGRGTMDRRELLQALAKAGVEQFDDGEPDPEPGVEAQPDGAGTESTPDTQESPEPDDLEAPAETEPTNDEWLLILRESTDQLRGVLTGETLPDGTELPPHIRRAVQTELGRRDAKVRELKRQEALQGPTVTRFRVTHPGVWFPGDGTRHELEAGSVVSAQTHPIAVLRQQGIRMVPVREVRTERDQLGFPVTTTR